MSLCASCFEPFDEKAQACLHCGYSAGSGATESVALPLGSSLMGRYTIGKAISSGSYGIAYIGWDKPAGCKAVIKEYFPDGLAARAQDNTSVAVFKGDKNQKLFHDGLVRFSEDTEKIRKLPANNGIVRIWDCFGCNYTAYSVMEYLDGVTLTQLFKLNKAIFPAARAIDMLMPVINALQIMHSENIIHGGVSPDNLFMEKDGSIKLIGLASTHVSAETHSQYLSNAINSGYSPEEQYRGNGGQGAYTDIYSIVAVLYRLITGIAPPDAFERRMNLEIGKKDPIKPISAKDVSRNQKTAIMNALNIRLEDRTPNIHLFLEELNSRVAVKRRANRISAADTGRLQNSAKLALMLGTGLLCAGVIFLVASKFNFHDSISIPGKMTRVPSAVNLTAENATDLLTKYGLKYSTNMIHSNAPKDFVLSQSLTAGSFAEKGASVLLTISGGPKSDSLPPLVDESEQNAIDALEALGFLVRTEFEYSPDIRKGNVIKVKAENNTDVQLAIGSTVTLYISRGPSGMDDVFKAEVPAIEGLSWDQAKVVAGDKGFNISIKSKQYHDTLPNDYIISQDLTAGSWEMNDQAIGVVISLGAERVQVPDVKNKSEEDAKRILSASGFGVTVSNAESNSVANGKVISQTPRAGEKIRSDGTIAIIVSSGKGHSSSSSSPSSDSSRAASSTAPASSSKPASSVKSDNSQVKVPNIRTKLQAEAQKELENAGFSVNVINEDTNIPSMHGKVVTCDDVGKTLTKGSTVTIYVGYCSWNTVPDVTGKPRMIAERLLQNAGFVPVVQIEEAYDKDEDGKVLYCEEEGYEQERGERIIIVIGKYSE